MWDELIVQETGGEGAMMGLKPDAVNFSGVFRRVFSGRRRRRTTNGRKHPLKPSEASRLGVFRAGRLPEELLEGATGVVESWNWRRFLGISITIQPHDSGRIALNYSVLRV
jgi:hypothetical protein